MAPPRTRGQQPGRPGGARSAGSHGASSQATCSDSLSLEDDDLEKELALLEEMENGGPQKTPVLFNADVSPLFLDEPQSSKKMATKKQSLSA